MRIYGERFKLMAYSTRRLRPKKTLKGSRLKSFVEATFEHLITKRIAEIFIRLWIKKFRVDVFFVWNFKFVIKDEKLSILFQA